MQQLLQPGTLFDMKYRLALCLLLLVWGCRSSDAPAPPPDAPPSEDTTTAPPDDGEPLDSLAFAAAGLETDEVRAFLKTLQQALARDDRQAVAALVSYPLTVQLDGAATTLDGPGDFAARYEALVNARVKEAVQAARPAGLFANWQGVRVGRGELWFGGVYEDGAADYTLKITAINPQ